MGQGFEEGKGRSAEQGPVWEQGSAHGNAADTGYGEYQMSPAQREQLTQRVLKQIRGEFLGGPRNSRPSMMSTYSGQPSWKDIRDAKSAPTKSVISLAAAESAKAKSPEAAELDKDNAEIGMSPYAPLSSAGDAVHDGNEQAALGEGDQVFTKEGKVVQAFPATPEGVVAAAFYELHRGRKQSLENILTDDSKTRTARGSDAAKEPTIYVTKKPKGSNMDGGDAKSIGTLGAHRNKHDALGSVGPIRAYFEAAGLHDVGRAWCGSFATFVYHRAGVQISSVARSSMVPNALARPAKGTQLGEAAGYYHMTGTEHKEKNKPATYDGALEQGNYDANGPSYKAETKVKTAHEIDVRPGDLFWQEHNEEEGHAGIIVGVYKTDKQVKLVTIEGNASDMVRTRVRTIDVDDQGKILSNIKGWGRPAALNDAKSAEQDPKEPKWIRDAHLNRGDNGGDR